MNGIHEVTGSIPVWSTNTLNSFRINNLHSWPECLALSARRAENRGHVLVDTANKGRPLPVGVLWHVGQ